MIAELEVVGVVKKKLRENEARAAARAVSHRAIIRLRGEQGRKSFFKKNNLAFIRFGRKKLVRNNRPIFSLRLLVDVLDETNHAFTDDGESALMQVAMLRRVCK